MIIYWCLLTFALREKKYYSREYRRVEARQPWPLGSIKDRRANGRLRKDEWRREILSRELRIGMRVLY